MVKNALPLILTSICLTATPVCAAEKVNAVLPVTCTARESTEKFAVLIEGDSVYKASPSIVYLSDGDNKSFTVSIEFIKKKETTKIPIMIRRYIRQKFSLQKMMMEN